MADEIWSDDLWPREVVEREGKAFLAEHGELVGIAEEEVVRRFGKPSCQSSSSKKVNDEWVRDEEQDYRYYLSLPHAIVVLVVSTITRTVVRVEFDPKFRKCVPGAEKCYGPLYAPE